MTVEQDFPSADIRCHLLPGFERYAVVFLRFTEDEVRPFVEHDGRTVSSVATPSLSVLMTHLGALEETVFFSLVLVDLHAPEPLTQYPRYSVDLVHFDLPFAYMTYVPSRLHLLSTGGGGGDGCARGGGGDGCTRGGGGDGCTRGGGDGVGSGSGCGCGSGDAGGTFVTA